MKVSGLEITEGSDIANLTVDSGPDFPASPTLGELFYKLNDGLYIYNGTAWGMLVPSTDLRLSRTNTAVVQKTPGPGEFSTITAAVAHVLTNSPSATNPWVIEVHPGIYTEAAPIAVPQFTGIIGISAPACIIQPAVATNDVFTIAGTGSRLERITIRNATGVGAAGVRITSSAAPTNLNTMAITGCHENLVLESTTTPVLVLTQFVRLGASASTKNLARVQSNSGQLTQLRMYVSNCTGASGGTFTNGVLVTGPGSLCEFNGTSVEGVANTGNGVVAENGASIVGFAGVTVSGFNNNIVTNNVGSAPKIELALSQSLLSGTRDLLINHPGTTGFFSGVANQTKIHIDPGATMSMLFNRSGSDSGVTIVGDINIGPTFETATQVSDLILETPPMGLMEGGEVTRASGLVLDIAAGSGYVRKNSIVTRVEWESAQVTLNPFDLVFLYIDENGAVAASEEEPSYETNIVLVRVGANATEVVSIRKVFIDIKSYGNHIDAYLRDVVGAVFRSGSLVTENTSTPRALDVSAGHWYYSTQERHPQAVIATPFSDMHRTAQGVLTADIVSVVDNATIDTPTGLVAMTPGYYTKHVLYTANDGVDLVFLLQHGTAEYATLEEAQVAPLPALLLETDVDTPRIASIITQQGNNAIVEITDIRPRIGITSGGSSSVESAAFVHGDLIGLTFDDHPQYILADGSRSLAGNFNLGGNDIINVGLVDGIDPSAHASRHLPGGADPIPVPTQPANVVLAGPTSGSGVPAYRSLVVTDLPAHNHPWTNITGTPTTLTGYGITDAFPAFTGDVTRPANSTVLTLSTTGVSSGTYKSVTVDLKGRVTAGSNPTTLTGYGITDAVPVNYLAVSGGVATLDATGHLAEDQIPPSLVGTLYKGTWNATTNTPTLASGVGTKGDFYIVATAGSTSIDGVSTWLVGDQIIFSGQVWQRVVGAPSSVSSVAGRVGAVTLSVADVSGAAANSAVVHLTGNETIAGTKTFSSLIVGSVSGNAATVTTNANLSGDVTSVGNVTTLPAVGVAGTYRSVTTDSKGRVTAGSNPTTLAGYGITDASPAFTGDVTKAPNSNVVLLSTVGTPGTYQVVTTDSAGRVIAGSNPTTLAGYGITDGISLSLLGAPNGVATLNSSGKVLPSQLPASGASVFKGTWNATTNTPTLVSSVGTTGNYYSVTVAGPTILDGTDSWEIGDQVIFNGTIWQKIPGSPSAVSSVAGRTGDIILTKADITDLTNRVISGTANQVSVTDGAGDHPIIALASNPIIPGSGSLTLPIGNVTQRPGVPVPGMIRYDSSGARFEVFTDTWHGLVTDAALGTGFQPVSPLLTNIAELAAPGFTTFVNGAIISRVMEAGDGISITNPDGLNGNPVFSFTGAVGTIENINTTGLLTKTGAETWVTRAIAGVTNQISVTNADGVDDNPTISIASNPIIPGTGSMAIPQGTTAQRTVGPQAGSMRFNTDINKFEFYQSGQWTAALNSAGVGVVPAQMTQLLTGQVPAMSGTNIIPHNNVIPVITNGATLFTRSITMSAPAARIMLSFPYWLDVGSPNTTVITQVFRSPFHGYQIVNVGANKTGASATNLVAGTTYTATITINGVAYPVSLLGSNASTYETLKNGLQNAIGTAGTVSLLGGNIKIMSTLSSTTASVAITAGTLFAAPLNGFVSLLTAVSGNTPGCLVSLPSTIGNSGRGNAASVSIVDAPGAGTYTYTVRVGSSTGSTWYVNSNVDSNNFGGFNTTSYSIMEIA